MDRHEDLIKIAELEKTIQELRESNAKLRATVEDYKKKEQSISSAIIASINPIRTRVTPKLILKNGNSIVVKSKIKITRLTNNTT